MITIDKEFYSNPYYFFLRDKGTHYNLYFSSEPTLSEAKKKDGMVKIPKEKIKLVKKYLEKLLNTKTKKSTEDLKGEIDELVNIDGAMSNSKIPILDPRLHPKKTMDQTVAAARITNDPISRGYRTYYGESIENVKEEDMSNAFGYEETKDLDGKETYKYFRKELELEPDDAKKRTEQQGKDPSGKRDERSKFRFKKVRKKDGKIVKKKDPNFVSKQILPEIQKQKAIKMIEDFLMDKGKVNKTAGDINKKEKNEIQISNLIKKNIKSIIKQAEKEGISKNDIIKLISSE